MKKTLIAIICILLSGKVLLAQQTARFITSGTIEFQKRVNTFQVINQAIGTKGDPLLVAALDQYKKSQPQFALFNSTLTFNNNKTLLTPILPETPYNSFQLNPMTAPSNTVYTDLTAGTIIMQKDAMGDQFLIKDNVRKIKWKLTDETRDILGYTCRRANGIVSDSIYVVAFYTDKIRVSSGPELFNGLPGMILQLAIPHENVSWVATKVIDSAPTTPIVAPTKGKAMTTKELLTLLEKSLSSYRGRGINIDYYIKILGLL
ncbi:MAG: GLPGLI family protein [Mucilaginibacter sp.]